MSENQGQLCPIKSKIGGQALIEGVMMRGLTETAMAVRLPDGTIDVEKWENKKTHWYNKTPFIRGIFNMIENLATGYKCLAKSADKSGMDEEEDASKFDKFLIEKFGDKLTSVITVIGTVLGVILAIGLFMFVPSLLVKLLDGAVGLGWAKSLVEGLIKILIFIGYMAIIANMKSIAEVYQYHGAEHKSIFCYENGLPLTVENVKIQGRLHPRCGTSFLLILLIISILIFSVVTWQSTLIRTLIKILLLPVVVGVAYEIIKLAGRYDNVLTRIISFPGLKLQLLTTREPNDKQIEVAIAALSAVMPENRDDDRW